MGAQFIEGRIDTAGVAKTKRYTASLLGRRCLKFNAFSNSHHKKYIVRFLEILDMYTIYMSNILNAHVGQNVNIEHSIALSGLPIKIYH